MSLVSCVYCRKDISVKCKKEDLKNEQNSCQEALNFHGIYFIYHFLPMFTFYLFIVFLSICYIATILKSQEWLTINCVVNVACVALLAFYIFRGSRMCEDYIFFCKPKTCMAMQKKTWMTTYLFK